MLRQTLIKKEVKTLQYYIDILYNHAHVHEPTRYYTRIACGYLYKLYHKGPSNYSKFQVLNYDKNDAQI